jgi:hypothetical protein
LPVPYLAPHFDPDVFVSYSHGKPTGSRAPLRDWTHALMVRLKDGLRDLRAEFDDLDIWMDPDIDPTAQLTDELKGKAGACGVLMIVMSERYLRSRWCQDELDWFKEQIKDRTGTGGRVFVIKAQETDRSQWPDFLRDQRGHAMTGFSFYDPDSGDPWGFQLQEPNDDYFKELGRVRLWLTKRLRELRERAAKDAQAKTSAAATAAAAQRLTASRRIYLHAPPESESARAEIDLALKGEGIISLIAQNGAGGGLAAWQREARDRLETAKRCQALVLLRIEQDERFVGDLLDIGVDERERIAGARGAPLPCAVLDKTGERLPIDIAPFGIEHFDVNRIDWRSQFRTWLDAGRGETSEAAP